MHNLIKAEWFKLHKNRSFWTLLTVLSVLSLAYPLLYYVDHKANGLALMTGAGFLLSFISGNAYVMKVSVAVLAGFFISGEYSSGVMKIIASSGHTRTRLYVAKLTVFMLASMLFALVFPVLGTAEAAFLGGFGEFPPGVDALFLARAIGLTLLYAAGFAAIGAWLAVMLTDAAKTVGVTLVFFIAIDMILSAVGNRFDWIAELHNYTVFKRVGDIGKPHISGAEWPSLLLVPFGTVAACGLLGIAAFRRKEIK